MRVRRLLLGSLTPVLLVLLAAGCQVRADVTIHVEEDGSGTVEVAVGVDDEALSQLPDLDNSGTGDVADLARMVRVDDLRAAGWDVGAPEADDSGVTWVRATKPFGTPEQAVAVLAELTGAQGPLRDWQVARERGFGQTRFEVTGTADLSGGLEAFGDAGLAAALDGEPLGEDVAAIEQRFGRPVADMLTMDVSVVLPGATESFSPVLGGEPVAIAASSTRYDWSVFALTAVAVLCGVGLVGVLGVRLLRRG